MFFEKLSTRSQKCERVQKRMCTVRTASKIPKRSIQKVPE